MRRADRLFALIQALRGGRLRTARDLADVLEVSERTIYRDIVDLVGSGVPIDGARGVGYLLRDDYFLPPLSLTQLEKDALTWGVSFVVAHGDEAIAKAAKELQVKLQAIDRFYTSSAAHPMVFTAEEAEGHKPFIQVLREAIANRNKVSLQYRIETDQLSERIIWPLSLEHWGKVWTLTSWCEARDAFRTFRIDRIVTLTKLTERFRPEPGKTMADFLADLQTSKGATCKTL